MSVNEAVELASRDKRVKYVLSDGSMYSTLNEKQLSAILESAKSKELYVIDVGVRRHLYKPGKTKNNGAE